jgi:hypothetical protein
MEINGIQLQLCLIICCKYSSLTQTVNRRTGSDALRIVNKCTGSHDCQLFVPYVLVCSSKGQLKLMKVF